MPNFGKKSFRLGKWLLIAGVVCLLGALVVIGRKAYRKLEPPRQAAKARAFMEKGDLASAALALRHALSINPNDVACVTLIAEYTERTGDAGAIAWRNQLVELQPRTLQPVLDCAQTALRFGDASVAQQVLEKSADLGKESPEWHALRGLTARYLGKQDVAVTEYAEAMRLDPRNGKRQFDHACALLARGWIEDRAGARAIVEHFKTEPTLRLMALRTLANDSTANGELSSASAHALELAALPEATFADHLSLLDLLRRTGSGELGARLAALQAEARGRPMETAELVLWMNRNGRHADALAWSRSFTAEEWKEPAVCAAAAASAMAAADWSTLEAFTNHGDWGRLEYFRCALLARVYRERSKHVEFRPVWEAAVAAAARQAGATAALARLADDWHWPAECEDLLRGLIADPKEGEWASRTLVQRLAARKNTTGLWQVTGTLYQRDKSNDAAANNYAMYSLLLGRDTTKAFGIARELFQRHPQEAKYVSTYAFALHVMGRTEEGLRALEALDPEVLQQSDIAAYRGVLFAGLDRADEAKQAFQGVKEATLLPEERELIRQARFSIEQKAAAKIEP